MSNKGRKIHNARSYKHLNPNQIIELKELKAQGWPHRELAVKFLISKTSVGNYLRETQ
jgi:hypothetical protein